MKKSLILQTKDMEQRDNCKASQMFQKNRASNHTILALFFVGNGAPYKKD